jgi:2-oxoglutarate ferredoxin oxidoreductase subunit delta
MYLQGFFMFARIEIDENRCKGCGLCTITCPRSLLELGDEKNSDGFTPAVMKSLGKCVGCALCAGMCPAVAIRVYSRQRNEYTGRLMPEFQEWEQKIRQMRLDRKD